MTDIQVPPFFWFRPVEDGRKDVCFRAGIHEAAQQKPRLAKEVPGSAVRLPLMETPSWKPPNGGFFHFGNFEAMVFLLRLYVHFMTSLNNPGRATKYNLEAVIKKNFDLSPLQGRTPKILLGDMTGHGGYAVPGHETHSSGQQIDIFYIPEDGTNDKCACGTVKGVKKWHLGLNALLLHCILEVGATSVVTDSKDLQDAARPPKGQGIKGSTRHDKNPVHADHFHVDLFHTDPRSKMFVAALYANAEQGILEAPRVFS